jgi:hypothetical protein
MLCYHRRYKLGDVKESKTTTPDQAQEIYADKQTYIALPLYLYDHSGISISTSKTYPYDDPWDAGQVGIIYATWEKTAKDNPGLSNQELYECAVRLLQCEVEVYDEYLRGETYFYLIEDSEDGTIDSCGGFIGMEAVQEEAERTLKYYEDEREADNPHLPLETGECWQ